MANKNILLIEPGYRNKYPPLGLMKIAQYHGAKGKKDNICFIKGENRSVVGHAWDRIYITTMFSFEWSRIAKSIDFAIEVARGQTEKIFVGGIAASLMHERFVEQSQWRGIRFIKGLLDKSPAGSLQLDEFEEELYADDQMGKPIEDLTPDYSILDQISYEYPVNDAYFVYASRGCIRKCKFCGVPKLEGDQRDTYSVTEVVNDIEEQYGAKKDLIFLDNNVVASPNFKDIIAEIRDLGFTPDATIKRGRAQVKRRVDFNQGVDARILCKDPMFLRELSTICISPLRIAFDHLGARKPYEQSIRYAAENGLKSLSNYLLYNFHDSPVDLFQRMRINVALNEEFDIRIFSFPMRYQPTDLPNRSHIGPKWNAYFLRSFQIMLQATHGIVSGAPEYFRTAYGDTYEEFERTLMRPHHFIFNRFWYEQYGGRDELGEYERKFGKLSSKQQVELLDFLSSHDIGDYEECASQIADRLIRNVVPFYVPLSKSEERKIWDTQRELRKTDIRSYVVPDEELVEDASLNDYGYDHNKKQKEQKTTMPRELVV